MFWSFRSILTLKSYIMPESTECPKKILLRVLLLYFSRKSNSRIANVRSSVYDKCMKRFKLQDLMSQNKSQLISFILYKPLQVTLSRNTEHLNVGKVPKRKRSHINSIKQMNVDAIAPPADPRIVSHPHMYFRFTHKILAS